MISPAKQFICPLCHSPFTLTATSWQCDGSLLPNLKTSSRQVASVDSAKQSKPKKQHSFDVAKQGYVNLLPVQQKKSKQPGDSSEAILARQRFLAADYYQPLQQALTQILPTALNQTVKPQLMNKVTKTNAGASDRLHWADIGCGEGYYTLAMAKTLAMLSASLGFKRAQLTAIDISKSAIVNLAKTVKAAHGNADIFYQLWRQKAALDNHNCLIYPLVASAANLPVADHSLDGISSIFSPILPKVLAQKLKAKGALIIVKPDVGHLLSVRRALFDEVKPHNSDKFLATLAPYFELYKVKHTQTSLNLPHAALNDLLLMTPYAYRANADKRQTLLDMAKSYHFKTQACFKVYVLQRR